MSGPYVGKGTWLGTSWYEGHLAAIQPDHPSYPFMDKDKMIAMLKDDVADLIKRVRDLEGEGV